MNSFQNFSSWPPEQEATFVPFEQRTVEAGRKATSVGLITAAALLLFTLIAVIGFWAPLKAVGEKPDKPAATAPK